ncbi:MAG: glycoside hydrolase [Candidatus Marinimicrobia bacterium]|nr:glycoside hydrolase [Candidatus Neomarinimicrobiota bacterium]
MTATAQPIRPLANDFVALKDYGTDTMAASEEECVEVAGTRQPVPKVQPRPDARYADEKRCFGIASSIARTPGGRLWCGFSSGGAGEGPENYGIVIISDDDGLTWSPPIMALDTDGDGPIRSDHVTFWTAPDGVLWLLWSQYPEGLTGPRSSQWAMTCANPDARQRQWSAPFKLMDEQNLLTTPTVLADGAWIFPTGSWRRGPDHPSRPIRSNDGGRHFELGGPLRVGTRPDFDEYMIVERRNGNLVIFNRHAESFLQCESTDGGRTWSEQQPNGIRHVNSRFVFLKLASGNWLLVKQGTLDWVSDARETLFPTNRGRSHLTAFLSRDEGLTWEGALLLDERDCSYPFGCQAADGTIYVSYERSRWQQPEILAARFTEEDVLAGQPVSTRAALRLLANRATGVNPKTENKP